jgi:hypothetical protein
MGISLNQHLDEWLNASLLHYLFTEIFVSGCDIADDPASLQLQLLVGSLLDHAHEDRQKLIVNDPYCNVGGLA